MGKDRVGWMYLDLACRAAEEYAATHPPRPLDNETIRVEEMTTNRVLWGNYGMAAYVFAFKHCSNLTKIGLPLHPL